MVTIKSVTMKELLDTGGGDYLKHDERVAQLKEPNLKKCFACTAIFETKSSEFEKNNIIYTQYILFKDFKYIAKDKKIPLTDAIRYAIERGDIKIFCSCPAHLYWGYKYYATVFDYAYGTRTEKRKPQRNNPDFDSSHCKHVGKVFDWILNHQDELVNLFATYYRKAVSKDRSEVTKVSSVSSDGNVENSSVDSEGSIEVSLTDIQENPENKNASVKIDKNIYYF